MPTYKWRRRPTKHFGEVWVPFAHIEIQSARGAFQAFAIPIDTGVVVSLLRRSVAELLQIDLESGRKVELSAVGGGHTTAFVHELPTRFDGSQGTPLIIPFAIAAHENVPNLLGRLGVFDRSLVVFDGALQETRLAPT